MSMTTREARGVMTHAAAGAEVPYAVNKARQIAMLKVWCVRTSFNRNPRRGGIPKMSKLFAVTGQNNKKNSGKRSTDTEILLREVQSKCRESKRYLQAVARMNY